jgi:YggT family protein
LSSAPPGRHRRRAADAPAPGQRPFRAPHPDNPAARLAFRCRIPYVRAGRKAGKQDRRKGPMIIIDPLIQIVIVALDIYIWVVIISVVLSWLVAFNVVNTRNQFVYTIGSMLHRLTEPALGRIRRFLPDLGGIDISPIILILLIYFTQMVLANILQSLHTGAVY